MKTDEARNLYARRKELSEPTFGIMKDQLGARRFLLRGLTNVRAEFTLLATAFNLRTLWRIRDRAKATIRVGPKWRFCMVKMGKIELTLSSGCTPAVAFA